MKRLILILCLIISSPLLAIKTNQELFEGKKILVIGGTGYLGSSIACEVLKYNPEQIIIFSRDEVKHYDSSVHKFHHHPAIHHVIGDIRDYETVLHVTESADIVFHVGALKRMDALESNVMEAIKTNIIGSMNVFNACCRNEVDKLLFISTDKACLPINAYGATKFLGEKIVTNYDPTRVKTTCMAVRFGNILESTRSVIPIFADKIKRGEDIPLTDERMTRFIIAHKDATELIFDALRYAAGGEIFVKKLPAFKITDLIAVLKEHYQSDNKVQVVGIRPGEKLHETLINQFEMQRAIFYRDYFIIQPSIPVQRQKMPIYLTRGTRVTTDCVEEYSSDQAVVPREELGPLLKKLGILS